MLKVAVIGATGYVGSEVVRLLLQHPRVEITILTSEQRAGGQLSEVSPQFAGLDLPLNNYTREAVLGPSDLAMIALPHGAAMDCCAELCGEIPVIDLSADFRLPAPTYEQWYRPHSHPDLIGEAVYGFPELYRDRLAGALLVAVPGCYPTASLLALLPLAEEGFLAGDVVVDAKSGVSGAGRSLAPGSLFSERQENVTAYGVGKHRHGPEIEWYLEAASGAPQAVDFTPHLVPMDRGILATVYARVREGADLGELYRSRYAREPFVDVLADGEWPQTKAVRGTNRCQIQVAYHQRTGRAVIVSAIDNLGKGAAGQAVQAMNLVSGLPETAGLEARAAYP